MFKTAKIILLISNVSGALLLGQTPGISTKQLMQESLGDTLEPKVSVVLLPMSGSHAAGAHTHPGPVFAYILEGDIENQVEPDPPKIYHAGDFFYEAPMHVHRLMRNLSDTEPAKVIVFQVGATGNPNPAIKVLLREPAEVANREARLITVALSPGATVGAHKHPGPVFAYVLSGEVENQVDPDPAKMYRSGDLFYEAPLHAHRMLRNPSKTEPAELLMFQIGEKGQAPAMGVDQ
jgi:quercetin dioxygenase-like cupin family protein